MVENVSVTLSLPKPLVRELRTVAASQDRSLGSLVAEAVLKDKSQIEAARLRFFDRIEQLPDLGTNGEISWTRDELHER